jgi:hypothetical protein
MARAVLRALYGVLMNTLDPMSRLKHYFQAEKAREDIREEMRKEMEMPLVISGPDIKEEEYINGYTTHEMFTLNNMLAQTKELGIKKPKHNYITDLLTRGFRVIKNMKG